MRATAKLIIITLFFSTFPKVHAYVVGQSCGQLFDQTGDVIAYIADLSQNQKLSVEQLARLYEALKSEDKFINPYTEQDAIASDAFIHWQKFEELIRDGAIDKKKLINFLEERLNENKRIKVERDQTKQETHDTNVKIKFHPIKRGSFEAGKPGRQALKTIDYDFEMMAHKLTQKQWALLLGENPSHFIDGVHTIEIEINGKKIKMQPDNPVEQVSWDDVQIYIQKLNELSEKDDPLLYQIIPDHVRGSKYRLPTEAEWEFVARSRGLVIGKHFVDPEKLPDYGWFLENSGGTTHPVGERLRQVVDGHEFEMFGNVWEWVADKWSNSGLTRVLLGGGCWADLARLSGLTDRSSSAPDDRSSNVGFRLVRIQP